MIDLFLADGIGGHGGPDSMLGANLARPLVQTGKYTAHDVEYKASIGPVNPTPNPYDIGPWFEESTVDGALKLAAAVRATPNLAAVGGYSGGAAVVSRLLEDMKRGAAYTLGLEIVWAVTVANPYAGVDPVSGDFGIAGIHAPFPGNVKHYEISNDDDGIPRCPKYSPLRNATDLGQGGTVQDWIARSESRGWQVTIPTAWNDWRFWVQPGAFKRARDEAVALRDGWFTAAGLLRGYLNGTAHGSDYWTRRLFDPVVADTAARNWEG